MNVQNLELEDDNVIIIDGSSIDSDLYSSALSPVINENTILDLLHPKTDPIVPLDFEKKVLRSASLRKRDRLGDVFRTLSFRNKMSASPRLKQDKSNILLDAHNILNEKNENLQNIFQNVEFNKNNNISLEPDSKVESVKNSSLYDNTQPLLYTPEVNLSSLSDCANLEDNESSHPGIENIKEKKILKETKKDQGVSTLRSLGRRLSFFRRKKQLEKEEVKNYARSEAQDIQSLFDQECSNNNVAPKSSKIDAINLDSNHEEHSNSLTQHDKYKDKTKIEKSNLKRGDPDSSYTVKSLNLQNQLQPYHLTLPAKSCLEPSNFDLNQLNHFNGSYILQKLQTGNCLNNLQECWNIWLGNTSTSKFQKKHYKILQKILNKTSMLELCDNLEFIETNLNGSYHQIYILKKSEIPIFHGKKLKKRLGEYVYVIPKGKAHLVWQSVTYLLLLGKFDLNSFGFDVRGVCWRRLDYNADAGFHLTFYVDDRETFGDGNMCLFLAELRVMIPENLKQYFKKCKTLRPGEKKISIVNID